MDSVFNHFNLLTLITQLIVQIKIWLSCVVNYIICGGKSIFRTIGMGVLHKFE